MSLAEHAKTAIQHVAENDIHSRCLAWFTAGGVQEHAVRLLDWIKGEDYPEIDRAVWDDLTEISESIEWQKSMIRIANAYYTASRSYDCADRRFNEAIRPLLQVYDIDDCVELIQGIESNGQTWERRRAYVDHRELRARALELDQNFNPARFPVFNRHLG